MKTKTATELKLDKVADQIKAILKENGVVGIYLISMNDPSDDTVAGISGMNIATPDTGFNDEGRIVDYSKVDGTVFILDSMKKRLKKNYEKIDMAIASIAILDFLRPKEKSATT